LKLEYGFVEAVLDSSFVHEEAFEDSCVREVAYRGAAEGEMVVLGVWGVVYAVKQAAGDQAGQAAGGIGVEQGVNGLVLDADGSF